MRHTCQCGLAYRDPHNFDEHKRVGCRVESGKGESLVPDPDSESDAVVQDHALTAEEVAETFESAT